MTTPELSPADARLAQLVAVRQQVRAVAAEIAALRERVEQRKEDEDGTIRNTHEVR